MRSFVVLAAVVLAHLPTILSAPTPTSQANVPFFTPTDGSGSWLDGVTSDVGEHLNVSLAPIILDLAH